MIRHYPYRLSLILPLLFFCTELSAQVPEKTDSLNDEKGKIVEKLESQKEKSGFGKFIYKTLVKKPKSAEKISEDIQQRAIPFSEAEGKIIRNIQINTHDPFGYSIENPEMQPDKFLSLIHI